MMHRKDGKEKDERIVLKTKDLAEVMGIGKDKAYALMRSAGFPSIRIGRSYFVTMQKLAEWLDAYAGRSYLLDD